jgi:nitrous oxidase accessory protein NosD
MLIRYVRLLVLVGLCALLTAPQIDAAARRTVRAKDDGLVLTLRAHVTGTTVIAKATLKNNRTQPWQYRGGCAPPAVQIRAIDASGNLVFGYRPPRVTCKAITILALAPGAHLTVHARFPIAAGVAVRAVVPALVSNMTVFQTRPINLMPGGS